MDWSFSNHTLSMGGTPIGVLDPHLEQNGSWYPVTSADVLWGSSWRWSPWGYGWAPPWFNRADEISLNKWALPHGPTTSKTQRLFTLRRLNEGESISYHVIGGETYRQLPGLPPPIPFLTITYPSLNSTPTIDFPPAPLSFSPSKTLPLLLVMVSIMGGLEWLVAMATFVVWNLLVLALLVVLLYTLWLSYRFYTRQRKPAGFAAPPQRLAPAEGVLVDVESGADEGAVL